MEREKEQMMREKEELMLRLQDYEEKTRKAEKGGRGLPVDAVPFRRVVMGGPDGRRTRHRERTLSQGYTSQKRHDKMVVWIRK